MAARAQTLRIGLVVLVSAAVGCGFDDLGVTSVSFPLTAVLAGAFPDDYDRAAAAMATGSMDVDVLGDHAHLTAAGLPVPPLGFDYTAMVQVAGDERAALPTLSSPAIAAESTGHSHGALATQGDATTETVHLGLLVPQGNGRWSLAAGSADLGGRPLGAIRSAMIMLMPTMSSMPGMMPGGVVLAGDAADAAAAATSPAEGGHTHGA